MAIRHLPANNVVRLHPADGPETGIQGKSHAIAKGEYLELIRIVLHHGETRPRHAVDAEMTVQCLAGVLKLRLTPVKDAAETERTLAPGELLLLAAGTGYDLRAEGDTVALLTFALPFSGSASRSSPGHQ
jgi:quercetin dioxygenase-like cupin family protein